MQPGVSRRVFLSRATALAALAAAPDSLSATPQDEPIIDIHQHLGYSGRPDGVFLAHQRAMGISTTILLPAGRPVMRPSTHGGKSNGLDAQAAGNGACQAFAQAHAAAYAFGANEDPDVDDAHREIAAYLDRGAVVIGEQKFGVACDSPAMQNVYALARERR